jgi:hypothetical protein
MNLRLYNPTTFDVLESFPRLQRKLFVTVNVFFEIVFKLYFTILNFYPISLKAVSLLKPGGRMVYSMIID